MAWSATGLFAIKAANITTCLSLSPAPLLITFYRPSWNCLLYLTVLHSICYYIGPASSAVKSESTASDPVGFLSLSFISFVCVCVAIVSGRSASNSSPLWRTHRIALSYGLNWLWSGNSRSPHVHEMTNKILNEAYARSNSGSAINIERPARGIENEHPKKDI
jgi:hypothetical protein